MFNPNPEPQLKEYHMFNPYCRATTSVVIAWRDDPQRQAQYDEYHHTGLFSLANDQGHLSLHVFLVKCKGLIMCGVTSKFHGFVFWPMIRSVLFFSLYLFGPLIFPPAQLWPSKTTPSNVLFRPLPATQLRLLCAPLCIQ